MAKLHNYCNLFSNSKDKLAEDILRASTKDNNILTLSLIIFVLLVLFYPRLPLLF